VTLIDKKAIFITGASGVGKTTLVNLVKSKYLHRPDVAIFGFDSIGVPSVDQMIKLYGSAPEWQRATTKKWVTKILQEIDAPFVILEGQVNLDFIYEAFQDHHFKNFDIILIDCAEEEMLRRLRDDRKQPHLANDNMRNWRAYLRKQAENHNVCIINTDELSIGASIKILEEVIRKSLN
jgi:GTPase SAR1 family protein